MRQLAHLLRTKALVFAVALAVFAAKASASMTDRSPKAVTIQNTIPGDADVATSPFSATGALCPDGSVETTARNVLSFGDGYPNLYVGKHFTCGDGSGTFDLALLVHLTFNPFTDNFVWAVTGGTGAFAHLRGAGIGTGDLQPEGSLVDSYRGVVTG